MLHRFEYLLLLFELTSVGLHNCTQICFMGQSFDQNVIYKSGLSVLPFLLPSAPYFQSRGGGGRDLGGRRDDGPRGGGTGRDDRFQSRKPYPSSHEKNVSYIFIIYINPLG